MVQGVNGLLCPLVPVGPVLGGEAAHVKTINALTELPRDFAVLITIAVHILVVDATSLYGLASMVLSTKIMTPPRLPTLFLTAGWPTTMYLFCSLLQMV